MRGVRARFLATIFLASPGACGGTKSANDGALDGSTMVDGAVHDGSGEASIEASMEASDEGSASDGNPLDGDEDGSGPSCTAALPGSYVPTWIPPSTPASVCSPSQVQALYDDCAGPARSTTTCNAFESVPSNGACAACMETPIASSTYGATISWHSGGGLEANIGGCMALKDGDLSASGCGAKYENWQSCLIAACSYCPPGTYESCATPAGSTTCGAYRAAADQCAAQPEYSDCVNQPSFEAYFVTFGALFCGGGSRDAGGG